MNNNVVIKEDQIENMIYEVRGKQIMLDSDLARLYECKNGAKSINLAVKRHKNRFPERYMFQLTKEEYYYVLRFQFETLELKQGKYSKYLPYVFTEEGASMLSAVLHTPVAEEMSVKIIDAFVSMRKYISSNMSFQNNINNIVLEDHIRIKKLEKLFDKIEEKKKVNEIYFDGQIFDAYSRIKSIFKEATKELVIIDGYADISVLEMIKGVKAKVILITKSKGLLSKKDIEKYQKQYNNLKVIYNNYYHDRYFIIDKRKIYHSGTSINNAGSKTFSINLLEDEDIKSSLLKRVKDIKKKRD